MTRTIVALAAASTLTLTAALAQQSSPPTSSAPPAVSQSDKTGTIDKASSMGSSTEALVTSQKPDEWLASKFKGTEVIGADNAKIGSVGDILFDKGGAVKAVIVGVGGFLGIGSKDVALALNSFQVVPGKDGGSDQLKLGMTKDQLASAAEFKPYEPPRPATPAAGLTGAPRPATAPPPARSQ